MKYQINKTESIDITASEALARLNTTIQTYNGLLSKRDVSGDEILTAQRDIDAALDLYN